MLKIKDGVDLKVLEKFGFIQEGECIYCKEIAHTYLIGGIFRDDISVNVLADENSDENRILEVYCNTRNTRSLKLDVFYDLIQAGLVEKVEEER